MPSGNKWPDHDLVDRVIRYLDDPSDLRGVWQTLHFMERHGLNFCIQYHELHAYLTNPTYSPIIDPQNLTTWQEHELVLALRDRIRQTLGRPKLTQEQRKSFSLSSLVVPVSPNYKQTRAAGLRYKANEDELKQAVTFIVSREPELIQAIKLQHIENGQETNGEGRKLSNIWIINRLDKHIRVVRPDLGGVDIQDIAYELYAWFSIDSR